MTPRLPYFPVWLDDLFGSHAVRALGQDPALLGGYLLLLFAQWSAPEESLPADQRELRRLSWLSAAAWKRLWSVVGPAFVARADGRLQHPRVEQERLRATGLSQKRSTAGRAGAVARWQTDGNRNGKRHGNSDGKSMPSRVGPGFGTGTLPSESDLGEDVTAREAPDPGDVALATRLCAAIRSSGVQPKHRASPSSSSVAGFGRLVRRLQREAGSADDARARIRAAIDALFADPTPDAHGFSWARQMLSGDAWAGKTRSGDAWKFDLVEAFLAGGGARGGRAAASPGERSMDLLRRHAAALAPEERP